MIFHNLILLSKSFVQWMIMERNFELLLLEYNRQENRFQFQILNIFFIIFFQLQDSFEIIEAFILKYDLFSVLLRNLKMKFFFALKTLSLLEHLLDLIPNSPHYKRLLKSFYGNQHIGVLYHLQLVDNEFVYK